MQVSAEIRWFWPDPGPADLKDWFLSCELHGCAPGGGAEVRTDKYLRPEAPAELGLKFRGKKPGIEIKGLISRDVMPLSSTPFEGPIEIWTKWSSQSLVLKDAETV